MLSGFRQHAFLVATLVVALAAHGAQAQDNGDDPPARAARLSYAHGATSFAPAGEDEWVDTVVNRPLVSGDRLWADDGGRLEIEAGSSALRLGAGTSFEFVNLDDRAIQVEVTQGTLDVSLRQHRGDEAFEIDTPTLAVMLVDDGRYRIDVDADGAHTTIAVLRGSAVARGDHAEYPLQAGDRVRFGSTDLRDAEYADAADDDDFSRFCAARDNRAQHAASWQYVGADVVGVLFKRLKSMTMIKKPLGIWTLAMFSAISGQTLGSNDNKLHRPASNRQCRKSWRLIPVVYKATSTWPGAVTRGRGAAAWDDRARYVGPG